MGDRRKTHSGRASGSWPGEIGRRSSRVVIVLASGLLAISGLGGGHTSTAAEKTLPRNGLIALDLSQIEDRGAPYADFDIFTVTATGAGLKQVSDGPEYDGYPEWSPDGRLIAFYRAAPLEATAMGDIYMVPAEGGPAVNLTNTLDYDEGAMSWSPDGTQLVFDNARTTGVVAPYSLVPRDLYIMDVNGDRVTRLTGRPGSLHLPAWSPDGRWIAFTELYTDAVEVIRPDGSGRRVVFDPSEGAAYAVNWSPDSRRLIVSVSGLIHTFNLDGSGVTTLPAGPGQDHYPAWSPDGSKIVFSSREAGRWNVMTMDSDGSNVQRLIELNLTQFAIPDWGPQPR